MVRHPASVLRFAWSALPSRRDDGPEPAGAGPGRRSGGGRRGARAPRHGAIRLAAREESPPGHGPGSRLRLPRRAGHARRPDQVLSRPTRQEIRRRDGRDDPRPAGVPARAGRRGRRRAPPGRDRPARGPPALLLSGPGPGDGRSARAGRRGVRAGHRAQAVAERPAGDLPGAGARLPADPEGRPGAGRLVAAGGASSPTTLACRSRSPPRSPRRTSRPRPCPGSRPWPRRSAIRSARSSSPCRPPSSRCGSNRSSGGPQGLRGDAGQAPSR